MKIKLRIIPPQQSKNTFPLFNSIEKQSPEKDKQTIVYLLCAIVLLSLISFIKVLFDVSFLLILVLMIIAILILLNFIRYTTIAHIQSKALITNKINTNISFKDKAFQVNLPKNESQNLFRYKDIQNLVFCFQSGDNKNILLPYSISWEWISPRNKKIKPYQYFFDATANALEKDFMELFHYLNENNISFSEVTQKGEKMRMLRVIEAEKPQKEVKIAQKYQKLIDEIGKS